MSTKSGHALTQRLRFPEFAGQESRVVQFKNVTAECTERYRNETLEIPVMGVSKAEGIVPMKEGLVASDTSRYKLVQTDWFAYNPMRLNIGSISLWKGEETVLVSPDYVVFRCLSDSDFNLSPQYLNQFRQSDAWTGFVQEGGDGGVRIRIYYKDLAPLSLPLPTIKEQRKIADCLSSLDELITAETQKLNDLKSYKQGLIQQLFPRGDEAVPRLRFPDFRDTEDWVFKELGDICDMQAGNFISASEISDAQKDGYYPCYGGNGLRGYAKTFNRSGPHPLIGRQGALCGNVRFAEGDFYATEHAIVTRPRPGISVNWLFHNLRVLDLNRFSTGQAQPGLSVESLKKVTCFVPPTLSEQQEIADHFSSLEHMIAIQTQVVASLSIHKQGLLQQLFPSVEEADR